MIEENGGPGQSRTADKQFRKLLLYPSELRGPDNYQFTKSLQQLLHTPSHFPHPSYVIVPPRVRMMPVAVVAGLVIMIATLLYAAFNRKHDVSPQVPPVHQTR